MRKCRYCKAELPKVKDCETIYQEKGFCDLDHMAAHGLEKAKAAKEKADRKELKARKEKLKTKSDYAREAQAVFNQYIRLRDYYLPCISCGRHHQGQYHAGHYRTVGSHPELRFEELNCHKQCSVCNNHKSGNIVEYRINLRSRIGDKKLDWLEGPHKPANYTIDDLKDIKKKYKKLADEIKSQLNQ